MKRYIVYAGVAAVVVGMALGLWHRSHRRPHGPPPDVRLERQLGRLGLITHADLQALLNQVTDLETQIDRIAAQRQSKE